APAADRRGEAASMGPPLFRGGHTTSTARMAALERASMGPPLFRGGHRPKPRTAWPQGSPLQWGHLSLEVVIGRPTASTRPGSPASMGPPLFRGGHSSFVKVLLARVWRSHFEQCCSTRPRP